MLKGAAKETPAEVNFSWAPVSAPPWWGRPLMRRPFAMEQSRARSSSSVRPHGDRRYRLQSEERVRDRNREDGA
jgi:hypothetical protein